MAPSAWWLLLGLLFFGGILFQIEIMAVIAIILAMVSGLASWWHKHALDGVTYHRRPYYRRGFPGEKILLQVEVENRKFLPISWLRARDSWPHMIAPEDENLLLPTHDPKIGAMENLFSLRWFERARRSYEILLRKRGLYGLGPVRLESGDLFGLFEQVREDKEIEYLTVFPQPIPFEDLHLPADDPFGDRQARRRLYEDPSQPMGIRNYHPEDDFRRIHWPATAHTGDLKVKVYQPVSAQVLVICLNVSTFQKYWEGVDTELLEYLISVTASLSQRAVEDGYRVGLLSNGCLAHADQPSRIPPGRSPQQLTHILETLAGLTPLVIAPFERLLMRDASQMPYGARLFIVTGVITPELAATLLKLKQRGRRITLLSFAPEPPPDIKGVRTIHLPFSRS